MARVGGLTVPPRRAPLRNESPDEILRGLLGYDESRIGRLLEAGGFGTPAARGVQEVAG